MDNLILLKKYYHKHDAEITVGLLKEAGIVALLQSDDAGGFHPFLTVGAGNNRVMIQKEDTEKALEVIKALDATFSEEDLKAIEDMAVQQETPSLLSEKKPSKKNVWLIPAIMVALSLVIYVIKEIHKIPLTFVYLVMKFVVIYIFFVNIITFFLYGYDKRMAIKDGWRISEKMLHLWMLCGGTLGAYAGQRVFRHKTIKGSFRLVFWSLLVLQVSLVFWFFKFQNG